jgi:hypothetical protein
MSARLGSYVEGSVAFLRIDSDRTVQGRSHRNCLLVSLSAATEADCIAVREVSSSARGLSPGSGDAAPFVDNVRRRPRFVALARGVGSR